MSTTIDSYVALGDSFTEGLNDQGPDGGYAGWADRLARLLAQRHEPHTFRYANLAVRGRLLHQIVAEQVPQIRHDQPDLVTLCGGGNDLLRPGGDPDELAERFEAAVVELRENAGTVLIFTGFDTRTMPILRHLRGKVATYNSHLRAIADRNDCVVADLWALRTLQERSAWSEDRLHLSPEGHQRVALLAARALGLADVEDPAAPLAPNRQWHLSRERAEDLRWARAYLAPWIGRRMRGESSGDQLTAKRPELLPL